MSYYQLFRRPKTQQERKHNQEGYCRPRRRPHSLVDNWDDIYRSDRFDRNWKRHRKTQYKTKSDRVKKDSTKYGLSMSKRSHLHSEHKFCCNLQKRCSFCKTCGLWDDYDKILNTKHKESMQEEEKIREKYSYSYNGKFSIKHPTIITIEKK